MKKSFVVVLILITFVVSFCEACERKSPRITTPYFAFNSEYFSDDMEVTKQDATNRRKINHQISYVDSRLTKKVFKALNGVTRLEDDFDSILLLHRLNSAGFYHTETQGGKQLLRQLEAKVNDMGMEELESKKEEIMKELAAIASEFRNK